MPSLFANSVQDEFEQTLGATQDLSRFKNIPNLARSIEARVARGVDFSTGKVIADLFSNEFDEFDDSEKIPILDLQQRFPDIYWTEPLTERQARRKAKSHTFRNSVQEIINQREQGVTSTIVGFGAEIITASLLSPETYVAPFAGRLATSTLSRSILQSNTLKAVGNAVRGPYAVATRSSAERSAVWVKRAEALQKKKFLAGFTEDLAITGIISEPLFQTREELIGNPQGAEDYFINVLATAAFSGAANSVLGRFVDRATISEHITDRSRQLSDMVTAQKTDVVDPVFRRMAKTESLLSEGFDEANFPPDFQGRVRIFYKEDSDLVSVFDETTGDIVINAAKIKNKSKLKSALENPQTVSSLKDGKFNFKTSKLRFANRLNKITTVEKLDLPSTQLDSNGISLIDGVKSKSKAKAEAEPIVDEKAPATNYDPANVHEVYNQQLEEMKETVVGFDGKSPEESSRILINQDLPEGIDVAEQNLLDLPEKSKIIDSEEVQGNASLDLLEQNRKEAIDDLKTLDNLLESIGDNSEEAVKYFNPNNKDLSPADLAYRRMLVASGVTADDFIGSSRLELPAKLKKELNANIFIKTRRKLVEKRAVDEWGGYSKTGKHVEVHEQLDGSLVTGGKYFDGQGDHVFGLMERYRNTYAHLFRGVLARHGVEKFFDNYNNEAKDFWVQVSRALDSADNSTNLSIEAREVGNTLKLILESQRTHLNKYGAGVRRLEGFLFTTIHNREMVVNNRSAWNTFFLKDGNIDWDKTIGPNSTTKQKEDFVNSFYKDIDEGFLNDVEVDTELHGGRKGEAFAKARKIHFKAGKQVEYNDLFGKATTAQTIMDQIELRAKAMAITERLGPDYKQTWKSISENLETDSLKDALKIKQLKAHYDEITGESNVVENQDIATFSNRVTNLISAIVNQGMGITIGISDLATQFVGLYSSGLGPSMGRSVRYVKDSYAPALRSLLRGDDNAATAALKETIIPYASNIEAIRKMLGDTSVVRQNNIAERLNLNVIKYSGAAFFTKLSQLTSTIGTQRAMADILKSGKLTDDFVNTLARFNISAKQFLKLANDPDVLIGNQLSVFHIKDKNLKRKLQNFLGEQMRLGSLMADPKQASHVKMGLRPGSLLGTAVRQVGLFMPAALAMHQKVLMRLAIMSNGDARFMELVKRGRRVEMAVVSGMLLGSATAIVTIKDILNNREPFWAGDKPLDSAHMLRVLKVSGVAPLFTEIKDIATGGMAGQMFRDGLDFAETVNDGSFVDVLANAKEFSPIPWTNFGPAVPTFDVLAGSISEEYLRDTLRRQLMFKKYTGQGRLFD